ncbi:hypothetical protein OE88DRAFT_1626135 [Heliocybe sulcata]|uniref:BCAS3 WD40 domain-containing protein n=1 Tax=Heliocybe sulcata TaxID=5364 RepID=A0A5C3N843_9AGAM|nr:hypothetical protein OE88DRAFT_1626135 [Heliocybe sulcata]
MHVYDLRRGRTSAVVEGVESAQDGRWVAMGTRKRTLHVFAANPYGGKTDVRSHVEGRVRDAGEVPLSTCLTPIVRLRFRARQSRLAVPLSFTFVHSSELSVPGNLLPPPLSYPSSPKSLSVQSGSPAGALKPLSPTPVYHRPTNFQDLLVFDPDDGSLSLRRFTLEESVGEQGLAIPGSIPIVGGVSVSLPAGVGRTGSPSSRSDHSSPKHSSGLGHVMERTGEMVAKEHVVATWSLRRSREWPEVRHVVKAEGSRPASVTRRKDWLAHAELSTCSRSKRLVPRAVYLSHQFTFHALGEDYHALVRRYQFDVPATKIEVRREVQASAYTMGLGESFVQGAHGAIDVRAAPSSFDEPLASAISAGLEYHNPYPPVIPMFPNGAPGSWSSGMKSIPIRSVASGISDGMNESFGRIRREFGRVRSPKMGARVDHGMVMSVPLEFDEEDEDFILPGKTASDTDAISRSGSGGSESIPTPSTHAQLLGDGDNADVEVWDADAGWTQEDRQAVDDAERFDDLVVGFMDEEQVKPEPPAVTPAMSGKGKRKAKRRM